MATAPSRPDDVLPPRGPLRLRLQERDDRTDGAWWPRSRDLEVEVADLVDHFPDRDVGISRVLVARADWANAVHEHRPLRRIRAARGVVNIGFVARDGSHRVVLMLASGRRLRLRVVPSTTDPAAAAAELVRP